MFCRICGEEKDRKEFRKIKHHVEYKLKHRIWCRDCQRMYVQKCMIDEKIKLIVDKVVTHVVVFN